MGCCLSRDIREPEFHICPEAPPLPDVCYPDKIGYGGVKVLTSTASTCCASTSTSNGRTYTRLVVGPDWIFAALFEAHGSSGFGDQDAAARFCAQHCYAEFQGAMEVAAQAASGTCSDNMCSTLAATLKALDLRYLSDAGNSPQDRLVSGCAAVVLHVSLGENPLATAAALGPCAAMVGQRRGGLASATSAPLMLCGGSASSHTALQGFLDALAAAEPLPPLAKAAAGAGAFQKGRHRARGAAAAACKDLPLRQQLVGGRPEYSRDLNAPQALGFGCGKGMRMASTGRGTAVVEPLAPRIGLEVQTSSFSLGPTDDCLVLLSGGATAGITPTDVALLMHRMGRLAAIPYETKPRPLPVVPCGPVVQFDSLGLAGPSLAAGQSGRAVGASAAPAIAPFNAARLLVQHAAANAMARGPNASGEPAAAMALALEWPRASDDSVSTAAASGASVSAVRAAAAAAASGRQRAQYRWQLLRLYYKFPHKRRVAVIKKWHEVFDRVVGEGKRTANLKETAAWLRLGAAVKVSAGGNVQCLSSRDDYGSDTAAAAENRMRTPPRRTSPLPWPSRVTMGGGMPGVSPIRGTTPGSRQQSRPPLSAAGASNPYSSPGGRVAGGTYSASPLPGGTSARSRQPSPAKGSTSARQRSPSLSPMRAGMQRCTSAQDSLATATEAAAAVPAATAADVVAGSTTNPAARCAAPPALSHGSLVKSSPSRRGPVGLLEVEGIDMQCVNEYKPRRQEATDGGSDPALSPSLVGMSLKSPSAQSFGGAVSPAAVSVTPTPSAAASSRHTLPHRDAQRARTPTDAVNVLSGGECSSSRATAAAATVAAATLPDIGAAPASTTDAPATPVSTTSTAVTATASATRIPSLSAAGPPTACPSGGGSAVATGDGSPPSTSRSRTPCSRIPNLQLMPGSVGAAAAAVHATPRLSMPGGVQSYHPTPTGSSLGGNTAPPVTATPVTRSSSTWGGAGTTPNPAGAAPNSAKSGYSRLPRPNSQATPAGSGAPAHSTSPAGSVTSRSFVAASDGGSVLRSGIARPPRLEVGNTSVNGPPSAVAAGTTATATTPGGESDLFSPDADQLAAWAMEAIEVIDSSTKKSRAQEQRLDPGPPSARSKGGLANAFGAVRSSGAGPPSGGCARSNMGSRIPLSPRNSFNNAANVMINSSSSSKVASRSLSRESDVKSFRIPNNANMGNSAENQTPQHSASSRSRR